MSWNEHTYQDRFRRTGTFIGFGMPKQQCITARRPTHVTHKSFHTLYEPGEFLTMKIGTLFHR